jgi:hypothetical protein
MADLAFPYDCLDYRGTGCHPASRQTEKSQPDLPSSQGPSSVSKRECSAEAGMPQAGSGSTSIQGAWQQSEAAGISPAMDTWAPHFSHRYFLLSVMPTSPSIKVANKPGPRENPSAWSFHVGFIPGAAWPHF